MSAKDPRRAILLYLPPDLRRVLKARQTRRRARSLADTVRQELLSSPIPEGPRDMPVSGRPVRLQLPVRQRAYWEAMGQRHGCSPARLIFASLMQKMADGGFPH